MSGKSFVRLGSRLFSLENGLIMGIVNATPDSFFAGSRVHHAQMTGQLVEKMVKEGVDLLDVGAVSTRPGAQLVAADEEWKRLQPVLAFLQKEFPHIPVSVDTYRSEIIIRCVEEYDVRMINDISAGQLDATMAQTVARLQIPVVLMHMQNLPETMQNNPHYEDVTVEVIRYLGQRIQVFKEAGVHDIVIDPGFGFGKSLTHNFELMANLDQLVALGYPVLVGISRKSMIYKSLSAGPDQALSGTIALNTIARLKGASIFRVHDVREARESIKLADQVKHPDKIRE